MPEKCLNFEKNAWKMPEIRKMPKNVQKSVNSGFNYLFLLLIGSKVILQHIIYSNFLYFLLK